MGYDSGDVLEGDITEIGSRESTKYKDDAGNPKIDPVLTIKRDDEELLWFAGAAAAKREVEKFDPPLRVGDHVAIGYHGQAEPSDDQSPHRWRVLREESPALLDEGATQEALEAEREQRDADLSALDSLGSTP